MKLIDMMILILSDKDPRCSPSLCQWGRERSFAAFSDVHYGHFIDCWIFANKPATTCLPWPEFEIHRGLLYGRKCYFYTFTIDALRDICSRY